MADKSNTLQTHVSQPFWCDFSSEGAVFEEAVICFGPCKNTEGVRRCVRNNGGDCENARRTAWLDQLFRGGIKFPGLPPSAGGANPLTVLVAGSPGTGKTTLCSEICYNLAECDELFSLYVSTESDADALVSNFVSFGHSDRERFVAFNPESSKSIGKAQVYIWGKEKVDEAKKTDEAITIVKSAVEDVAQYLAGFEPKSVKAIMRKIGRTRPKIGKLSPTALVFDSLNTIPSDDASKFINSIIALATQGKTDVLFLVLDSSADNTKYRIWEHTCDVVIRLSYTNKSGYYTRAIEVVKARYQSHIWGEQQFKIYRPYAAGDTSETMRRSHPYRKQGGIFIYPSIHYYLSEYRYKGPPAQHEMCQTLPNALNVILTRPGIVHGGKGQQGGFPRGRCTAFIGGRGGHKSHLAYLHLLYRMSNLWNRETERHAGEEGAIIISLRDDENMTRSTMNGILKGFPSHTDVPNDISTFEDDGQLEILYFHPGYITPQEVFHRIFIAVQRLKRKCRRLTVLLNSLDQLSARFPLCAKEEMFIPGLINFLIGEHATSIVIAVPEEGGQPSEQYGLLPMADLILSFNRKKIITRHYIEAVDSAHSRSLGDFAKRASNLARKQKEYIEEVVVEVVRFSGGQRAGACGILELVNEVTEDCIYDRPGLHFSPLLVGGWEYFPRTVVAATVLGHGRRQRISERNSTSKPEAAKRAARRRRSARGSR